MPRVVLKPVGCDQDISPDVVVIVVDIDARNSEFINRESDNLLPQILDTSNLPKLIGASTRVGVSTEEVLGRPVNENKP
jgi:hypothetical protein